MKASLDFNCRHSILIIYTGKGIFENRVINTMSLIREGIEIESVRGKLLVQLPFIYSPLAIKVHNRSH